MNTPEPKPMEGLAEELRGIAERRRAMGLSVVAERYDAWADAVDRSQSAGQDAGMAPADTNLLDFIQAESIDLRSFAMGDDDVGWRVILHSMGKPAERVVSEVFKDDPRKALREAMLRLAHDPYCDVPLHVAAPSAAGSEGAAPPWREWKCGNEFLPFHPQASHVPPEYRDGWNECFRAAQMARAQHQQPEQVEVAIATLVNALAASKGWMRDYAEAIIRDAIDRKPAAEKGMADPAEPIDDSDRVKPCANCGHGGEYQQQSDGGYFIECTNPMCGMSTCLMYACGEDPKPILMEKWNRRVAWARSTPAPEGKGVAERRMSKEAADTVDEMDSCIRVSRGYLAAGESCAEIDPDVVHRWRVVLARAALAAQPVQEVVAPAQVPMSEEGKNA